MAKRSNSASLTGVLEKPIVFCDFDGTVTQEDVTDRILEELADSTWRELEAAWVGGQMGSRECLERQMALVRASEKELNRLIDAIPIDPGFAGFYRFTEKRELPFYIVSDGFDYVIRRVLRRTGAGGELCNPSADGHLFSSTLTLEGSRARVEFPHDAQVCEHGCGTCKAAIIRRIGAGHRPVIFIGDGLSDRFAVEESDLIFAKKQLLTYCRNKGIACHPFETFREVETALAARLRPATPESRSSVLGKRKVSKPPAVS